MQSFDKKKKRDKTATIILLCFCVIALTSLFTIRANINKVARSAENIPVAKETPTGSVTDNKTDAQKDIPKEEADLSQEVENESEQVSEEASAEIPVVDSHEDTTNTQGFVSPMNMSSAKVIKEYSMDMVIYNKTLDQYMTHPGIDIQAGDEADVVAVADGIVSDVRDDDAYGITIEITHDNGYVSRYSNLATDKMLEKGDIVKANQVISTVGKSAMYEGSEKTHLHFELLKDSKNVNPDKHIKF